jgi:hypothetical protein
MRNKMINKQTLFICTAALEAIAYYRRKWGRETTGLARIYQEALALFAVTLHTR